jgi:hypothetical protein
MDTDRIQELKDRAHAIWEAEGRPDGRADQHWRQAEEQLAPPRKEALQAEPISTGTPEIPTSPETTGLPEPKEDDKRVKAK